MTDSERHQLEQAAEVARYENDQSIYNLAREQIHKDKIEQLKLQDEQLRKAELERQYREREQEDIWDR
ncbi:hypothetical protein [uncultured Cohaesibacter sp.]|uniref:hypothetical protein n=1 Tax=uncultured Cohaesibacter sp. TaxID=1002546 RepID=UPI002931866D|nr:hypothetical protein [uncultured Cohaesibacter sp.]